MKKNEPVLQDIENHSPGLNSAAVITGQVVLRSAFCSTKRQHDVTLASRCVVLISKASGGQLIWTIPGTKKSLIEMKI